MLLNKLSLLAVDIAAILDYHKIELNKMLESKSNEIYSLDRIIGLSPLLKQVKYLIRQVADSDISVLITGESGSGKELIADGIHKLSNRHSRPLITVNCGAIPEGIFESEVFGHEKGSFTSAERKRKGYFEMADGGTLFLDEIGEMPLSIQVKLLRVLEVNRFLRVGGSNEVAVDVRIIAATNQDLSYAVEKAVFRRDLYYRLNAVTIKSPALRDRPEDIPVLTEYFANKFCERNNRPNPHIESEAIDLLQRNYWSGNVRELKNFVESIITLSSGSSISAEGVRERLGSETYSPNLPVLLSKSPHAEDQDVLLRTLLELKSDVSGIKSLLQRLLQKDAQREWGGFKSSEEIITYPVDDVGKDSNNDSDYGSDRNDRSGRSIRSMNEIERDEIFKTLMEFRGNRRLTAKALGIGERTLYRKIKEYNLK